MIIGTSPAMNDTSAAPARSGIDGRHGPAPRSRLAWSYITSSSLVAVGRRQRRIAVVERDRRLGVRQRRLRRSRASSLFAFSNCSRSTARAVAGRRPPARRRRSSCRTRCRAPGTASSSTVVPPTIAPGLKVRCGSPASFSRNAFEDARRLEDRAVARVRRGRSATSAPACPSPAASSRSCRGARPRRASDRRRRPRIRSRRPLPWPPR